MRLTLLNISLIIDSWNWLDWLIQNLNWSLEKMINQSSTYNWFNWFESFNCEQQNFEIENYNFDNEIQIDGQYIQSKQLERIKI